MIRELAELVAAEVGVSNCDGRDFARLLLDRIVGELLRVGRVEIRDFGVLRIVRRAARRYRNPKTGAPVDRPARSVVVFRVGANVRAAVRGAAPWPPTRRRLTKVAQRERRCLAKVVQRERGERAVPGAPTTEAEVRAAADAIRAARMGRTNIRNGERKDGR